MSNLGNVRSNIKSGRILKNRMNRDGYHDVNLYKNTKMQTKQIHRLVANAF